jgi:hypothetical protein
MILTFESDKDVIVYALEKIISYARENQYIFLAQSVWWISSILHLQEGLIIHIDNLKAREEVISIKENNPRISFPDISVHPDRVLRIGNLDTDYNDSESESVSTIDTDIYNEVIDNCEAFLEQSKQERKNIERSTRQASRVVKRKANKKKPVKTYGTQTEGIDGNELRRCKAAGECQRCAWPRDRKGSHKTLDCFRWKQLEKGTAPFPKKKNRD